LIALTLLNGNLAYVNPNVIEIVESTPDTMLTLTTGKKLIVRESPEEVAQRFTEYAAKVARPSLGIGEEAKWT
jgi:flagellar protein FlbD